MTSSKLIVVIGATGIQGGSVAKTYLKDPSWTVRAVTRNANSSKAQLLQQQGAEVVEANLNDVKSLEKAFQGATAIFVVTDFWTLFADAELRQSLKPGQHMIDLAFDLELEQGKNVFTAAATTLSTLERLVYSTLPNVTALSKGKYSKALHFDAKALAVDYGRDNYPEVWAKTSLIYLGFFATNFSQVPMMMPQKNKETNIYEFRGLGPELPLPLVVANDDTGVFVKALVDSPSAGHKIGAFRQSIPVQDFVKLWGQTLNVKAEVSTLPPDESQVPLEIKEELADTFGFGTEYGFFGEKADDSIVMGREFAPSLEFGPVKDWIKAQDWSAVIKA